MVVTDVGGNAEAVRDGLDGYTVPARDPAALAQAIAKLANDRQLAIAMGASARQRAEELFSIEACIANYERFYLGLSEGRAAADVAPHN